MILRYYRFLCPGCGREFANKLSPVLLGTGIRRCRKCGLVFKDGCKEWPELSRGEKFKYFFPTMVLGFVIGAVVVGAFAVLSFADNLGLGVLMGLFVFLLFMLPWSPYFLLQWRHIPKSRARYERHGVVGETEEFIL